MTPEERLARVEHVLWGVDGENGLRSDVKSIKASIEELWDNLQEMKTEQMKANVEQDKKIENAMMQLKIIVAIPAAVVTLFTLINLAKSFIK